MFIAIDRFILGDIIPIAFEASRKDDNNVIDVDQIDGDRINGTRAPDAKLFELDTSAEFFRNTGICRIFKLRFFAYHRLFKFQFCFQLFEQFKMVL